MAWWNNGSSLANSLVDYWKLDEASGNRVGSVNANTLTDNNTVTSSTGRVHSLAAQFASASSEYLSIADNATVSVGNIDFFVAAWVYLTDKTAVRDIVSQYNNTTNQRAWRLFYDNAVDRFSFGVSADGGATVSVAVANSYGAVPLNTWILVIAWHDPTANTVNISINAREPDSVSHTTGVFDSSESFKIGAQGTTSANNPGFFWNGMIGPVAFGKNYTLTAQDRITILKEAPSLALSSWWLASAQVTAAHVKEHVELPDIGQVYAGGAIADGQPWTVAFKSFSYLASANQLHYAFDSQDGQIVAGISNSSSYGFYNGSTWTNVAIFNTAQEQIWFFVSNGSTIQAYLNNVAVGSASSSSIGLNVSGLTRWAAAYDNSAAFWNNPILYGAVYDVALDAIERKGLYYAMLEADTPTEVFTASDSWVAPDGVTQVAVTAWGPGGNGSASVSGGGPHGGNGGGGGACATTPDIAVTPGNTYTVTVGTGGSQVSSVFTGDSESVIADAGNNAPSTANGAGAGGTTTDSTGDTKFGGGSGRAGQTVASSAGGGGGGGAGSVAAGGSAGAFSGGISAGGTGGAVGGGNGGNGRAASLSLPGIPGFTRGGGGGGPGNVSIQPGGAGAAGAIEITWTYPTPPIEVAPDTASGVGTVVSPTTVKGSFAGTPTADSSVGTTVAPAIIQGSITLSPTAAEAVGTTIADAASQGSVTVLPSATAAVGAVAGPDVAVAASIEAATTAEAVSDTQGPTVVLGSAVATPVAASAVVRTIGGQVAGSNSVIAPDPADAGSTTVSPTVVKGPIVSAPAPVTAVGSQVEPTVVKGSIILTPAAAAAIVTAVSPLSIKGAVVLTPVAARAVGVTLGEAAVGGAAGPTIIPAPAGAVGAVHGPTHQVVGLYDRAYKKMSSGVFKGMH